MSLLLALPVELVNRVVAFIDSPTTLASLNQTCKLFQELTEGPLYESVLIINGKGSAFDAAIESKPERKARVKEILVDCNIRKNNNDKYRSACTLAPLFAEFENLEVLSLSSGYWHWNDDDRGDPDSVMWEWDQANLDERFRKAGLATPIEERIWTKLRFCTLDLWEMNGQGWYCDFEPAIFLVASLEELTIRGCRFTDEDGSHLFNTPYTGKTALRKLTLERCYIHHQAVSSFLCAPKALTHLTLGHSHSLWHHEMGDQSITSDHAEDYMAAFRRQKSSLQFLNLGTDFCREIEEGVFDFSTFLELRDIQYDEENWFLSDSRCLRLRYEEEL